MSKTPPLPLLSLYCINFLFWSVCSYFVKQYFLLSFHHPFVYVYQFCYAQFDMDLHIKLSTLMKDHLKISKLNTKILCSDLSLRHCSLIKEKIIRCLFGYCGQFGVFRTNREKFGYLLEDFEKFKSFLTIGIWILKGLFDLIEEISMFLGVDWCIPKGNKQIIMYHHLLLCSFREFMLSEY